MSIRSQRASTRQVRGRAAALLVLGMFVFAEAGSFAHQALEVHATCAEHGEQIHVDPATKTPARPTSRVALPGGEGAGSHDDHHHCSLVPASRDASVISQPPATTVALVDHSLVAAALDAQLRTPAIALHRLAPKTSPPV